MADGDKLVSLSGLRALHLHHLGQEGGIRSVMAAAGIGGNIVEPVMVAGSVALSNKRLVYTEATKSWVTPEGSPFIAEPGTVFRLTDKENYKFRGWYAGTTADWYTLGSLGVDDIVTPGDKQRKIALYIVRADGAAIAEGELDGKLEIVLPTSFSGVDGGLYRDFCVDEYLQLPGALPAAANGVASVNTSYRVTRLLPVRQGMGIAYGLTSAGGNVIAFYDKHLQFLSAGASGTGTATVAADGFVRFSADAGSTGNWVSFTDYGIPDKISRRLDPIDETLTRDVTGTAYMQAGVARITGQLKAKSALGNLAVFGFNTDQHIKDEDDAGKTLPVLRGLEVMSRLTREYPFDFICLGGDACVANTEFAGELSVILDECVTIQKPLYDAWCPVVPITGNHDAAQNNGNMTGPMLFNAHFRRIANSGFLKSWDSSHTNGVWDSEAHQIRFIFFDDTIRADYDQATRNGALTAMLAGTPEGYRIVILSHHPLSQDLTDTKWQNPTACQNILHDYAGRIICCVCGHSHADVSEVSDGILYIGTTMAQFGLDLDGNTGALGTEAETAFDVFVIDQANLAIYAFRYGKGESREWTYTLS